ncbi:MAG: diguanylate cyclase (GGDEF)-like protein [Glaciecola sp.]
MFFAIVRRAAISLPSEFDFKVELKTLMALWAEARKHKSLGLLEPFRVNVSEKAQSVATFALSELQDILSNINEACSAIESKESSFAQVRPDIDMLMNKLISNAQKTPNPLLIESDESFNFESVCDSTEIAAKKNRRMSIAIVDDEKSTGMATAALISEFNFNVEYFENVNELNTRLNSVHMDLVLLDITMPRISTDQVFEFAATLNKRGIKVISYSGLFNFDMRLAAVRAGVADFIVKPTSILGIIEKINRVLHLQKTRNYRIVFIDDQKSTGEFYQTILEDAECEVYFMDSVEKMFEGLDDIYPDLFLLDMNMPEVNGLEAAKMIRQQKQFDFTPIVFLTADEQIETKLGALEGGADDVIAKSTPPSLVIKLLLTRLRRSMAIREFVSKDSLTGVLNHGQVMEAAMTSFRLSERQKSHVSIAMLDLDHFKSVNDTFGHAAGDKVLSGLGQLLHRSLRSTDHIGRYGGEEFMIVLVDSTPEESIQKLTSIKNAFADIDFEFKDKRFRCTFSVGIANLDNNESLPHAINQADQALYLAKKGGRNLVTIYQNEENK